MILKGRFIRRDIKMRFLKEGRKYCLSQNCGKTKANRKAKPVCAWNDRANENKNRKRFRLPLLWCIMSNINFISTKLLHVQHYHSFSSFVSLSLALFHRFQCSSSNRSFFSIFCLDRRFPSSTHIAPFPVCTSSHINWTPAFRWESEESKTRLDWECVCAILRVMIGYGVCYALLQWHVRIYYDSQCFPGQVSTGDEDYK